MRMQRRVALFVFTLGATLLVASSAWAWCTPYTKATTATEVSVNRAAAGTEVTVKGTHWSPGPVEVRWDKATGVELGVATVDDMESFSLPVTIPRDALVGWHQLVVVRSPSERFVPFEVLAADDLRAPAAPPEGSAPTASEVTTSGRASGSGGTPPAPAGQTPSQPGGDRQVPAGATSVPVPAGDAVRATKLTSLTASSVVSRSIPASAQAVVPPAEGPARADAPEPRPERRIDTRLSLNSLEDTTQGLAAGRTGQSALSRLDYLPGSHRGTSSLPDVALVMTAGAVVLAVGCALAEVRSKRRATESIRRI